MLFRSFTIPHPTDNTELIELSWAIDLIDNTTGFEPHPAPQSLHTYPVCEPHQRLGESNIVTHFDVWPTAAPNAAEQAGFPHKT